MKVYQQDTRPLESPLMSNTMNLVYDQIERETIFTFDLPQIQRKHLVRIASQTDEQNNARPMPTSEIEFLLTDYLAPLNINSLEQLIQVCGGVVHGAKYQRLYVINHIGHPNIKTFRVVTSLYDSLCSFSQVQPFRVNNLLLGRSMGNNTALSLLCNQIRHASNAGFRIINGIPCWSNDTDYDNYYFHTTLGFLPAVDYDVDKTVLRIVKGTQYEGVDSYIGLIWKKDGVQLWRRRGSLFKSVFDLNFGSMSMTIFCMELANRAIMDGCFKVNRVKELHKIFDNMRLQEEMGQPVNLFTKVELQEQ